TQRSSLQLVDSAGLISEQIALNPFDYCPYSATGNYTVGGESTGSVGHHEHFNWLKSVGVSAAGCVVVMRVGGGVSFAEKVWLAERNGAGGVLIYPDPADLPQDPRRLGLNSHTAVHLGSGDPFTPGFPSFNHSKFPPIPSSGLPLIPALPITATVAAKLLSSYKPLISASDQYIILGAQRDSLGPGAVKSGVGTAILLELARTFSAMVKKASYRYKRMSYLTGDDDLAAYTSPLLVDLLDSAIKQNMDVRSMTGKIVLLYLLSMKPLYLNSGAYSFTAFAGVPAMELRFTKEFLGGRLGVIGRRLGELVGEMVLRLVHDHILPLRITSYAQSVLQFSAHLNKHSAELQVPPDIFQVDRWCDVKVNQSPLCPLCVFSPEVFLLSGSSALEEIIVELPRLCKEPLTTATCTTRPLHASTTPAS
ncbi:hypothetical protein XENOCAPTIV_008716, partial [Xenoophorus captivus]